MLEQTLYFPINNNADLYTATKLIDAFTEGDCLSKISVENLPLVKTIVLYTDNDVLFYSSNVGNPLSLQTSINILKQLIFRHA